MEPPFLDEMDDEPHQQHHQQQQQQEQQFPNWEGGEMILNSNKSIALNYPTEQGTNSSLYESQDTNSSLYESQGTSTYALVNKEVEYNLPFGNQQARNVYSDTSHVHSKTPSFAFAQAKNSNNLQQFAFYEPPPPEQTSKNQRPSFQFSNAKSLSVSANASNLVSSQLLDRMNSKKNQRMEEDLYTPCGTAIYQSPRDQDQDVEIVSRPKLRKRTTTTTTVKKSKKLTIDESKHNDPIATKQEVPLNLQPTHNTISEESKTTELTTKINNPIQHEVSDEFESLFQPSEVQADQTEVCKQSNVYPSTVWERFAYFSQTVEEIQKIRVQNYNLAKIRIPSTGVDKLQTHSMLMKYHNFLNEKLEQNYRNIIEELDVITTRIIQLKIDADSLVLTEPIPEFIKVKDHLNVEKQRKLNNQSWCCIILNNRTIKKCCKMVLLVGFIIFVYCCLHYVFYGRLPTISHPGAMRPSPPVLFPPVFTSVSSSAFSV